MELLRLYFREEWDGAERHYFQGEAFLAEQNGKNKLATAFPHDIIIEKHIRLYTSLEDWKENRPQEIRRRALAKLTPEEINALGIKP